MPVQADWIRFGDHAAYLARPQGVAAPQPAVVVIQEIWGTDGHIQDVTRRLAAAGYTALAPDLYAEGGVRPPALVQERITEVMGFMNNLPPAAWGDPEARAKALVQDGADLPFRLAVSGPLQAFDLARREFRTNPLPFAVAQIDGARDGKRTDHGDHSASFGRHIDRFAPQRNSRRGAFKRHHRYR